MEIKLSEKPIEKIESLPLLPEDPPLWLSLPSSPSSPLSPRLSRACEKLSIKQKSNHTNNN